ncbi:UDP-N-acetylglucosamine 2-epimerase [Amylibacter sp.]|nr:UDP-N-acetylglucosamine 2-epimerase [Amylibacter sp.]
MKKKILAFTAIRSEYDLLSGLYILLSRDKDIDFKVIVSGAHLSEKSGYTVKDIEEDGLEILAKIETLQSTDTKASRVMSGAILLQNSINLVSEYKPDMIIYAGDREEVIVASIIGGYLEIPTVHFFGGDHVKDSHIDNPVRHATSKMSTIHMVSTEEHARRLIMMGEDKKRVYNIGSVALDKFKNDAIYTPEEIKDIFDIDKDIKNYAILIFHPIPKERSKSAEIFENILISLKKKNIFTFVSYPNIDPGSSEIVSVIEKYKEMDSFYFYKSQPRKIFLSIYKNADFIIGNSSSGVIESASIPIAAINVGYRQTSRASNKNIIFTDTAQSDIEKAIETINTNKFQHIVKSSNNIYGDGNSLNKAFKIIKNNSFNELLFKDEDILEKDYE